MFSFTTVWTSVGALAILGRLDVVDKDTLCWWLCERQLPNGGLNGRPEKLEDVSSPLAYCTQAKGQEPGWLTRHLGWHRCVILGGYSLHSQYWTGPTGYRKVNYDTSSYHVKIQRKVVLQIGRKMSQISGIRSSA
jgi:hypothetical protein